MNSYPIIPIAKKSTGYEWFLAHSTSGAIYPGVPLVSLELFSLYSFATPKSVILA
jgi:hypothetical protein